MTMTHAVREDEDGRLLLLENVIAEGMLGRALGHEYVVHLDGDALNNTRANLEVRPLTDISQMISGMAGVMSVEMFAPTREDEGIDSLYTFIELDGSSQAWLTVANLRDSGAVVQCNTIEGVDGWSDWLVVVERAAVEDFALALSDVASVTGGGR